MTPKLNPCLYESKFFHPCWEVVASVRCCGRVVMRGGINRSRNRFLKKISFQKNYTDLMSQNIVVHLCCEKYQKTFTHGVNIAGKIFLSHIKVMGTEFQQSEQSLDRSTAWEKHTILL